MVVLIPKKKIVKAEEKSKGTPTLEWNLKPSIC